VLIILGCAFSYPCYVVYSNLRLTSITTNYWEPYGTYKENKKRRKRWGYYKF
jgi:hypothetical protein